jgi:DNA-binding NarL/FixJ family response regulator
LLALNAGTQQTAANRKLSPRQEQITRLVALGWTDKQIANELGLSEGTVGWYMQQIFKCVGVHSRAALTAYWLKDAR